MLIALAKYCDKKYLCLIILFVLLGSGPIFATLFIQCNYRYYFGVPINKTHEIFIRLERV